MPAKRRLSSPALAPMSTNVAPHFKKPRIEAAKVDSSLSDILETVEEELVNLPHDKLVSYITTLQEAYQELATKLKSSEKELKNTDKAKTAGGYEPSMSADEIKAKARKIADIMGKEIRKQMKWQ